ncbi:MAG: hypothetical protein KGI11_09675 [Thaumarchaeota archaeon]|nr:hypothetical protein [Nitrososphaerota archaeon]
MPFISSRRRIDGLIAAAEAKGWQVDDWWRDETKLAWPDGAQPDGMLALDAGGCVAWLARHVYENAQGWVLAALGPRDGVVCGVVVDGKTLVQEDGRLPPDWITTAEVRANKRLARQPVELGDLVACVPGRGTPAYLGRAIEVRDGAAVRIELESGAVVPARLVGRHWFGLRGREAAAAWFWNKGRVEWPSYLEMRTDLRHMERKLNPEGLAAHDAERKAARKAEALAREIADLI